MNKIPRPTFNDNEALETLASNQKVGSYPVLKDAVTAIQQGYVQYKAVRGNANSVAAVYLPLEVEGHLKAHYKNPPLAIKHIKSMREEAEHRACPMCGSLHRGTLDHLLPQSSYAAFALFSLNLVPACKCNIKRKDLLFGSNANERILHPYFDDCLSDRLVEASFEDLGGVPRVGIRLCVDATHPEFPAISFHFNSIVKRTGIIGYLRDRWLDLCREPRMSVRALKEKPVSPDALRAILEDELNLLDETHRGKNNWNSIFVAGLLDPNVLDWVFQRMHTPGRLPNGPLI